jgi:hypothetical protein
MKVKSIHSAVTLLAGLVMALVPAVAHAQPSSQPGVSFAMIGVATGQSARVNALNLGSRLSTQDSSCSVTLQFLDTKGQVLKQTAVTLPSGKATSLDLSRDAVPGDEVRAEIRAVLLFGYSGGASPGPDVLQQFDCNIVPSIEVYDNDTGKTNFILTDAKPLPLPDPRSIAKTGSVR